MCWLGLLTTGTAYLLFLSRPIQRRNIPLWKGAKTSDLRDKGFSIAVSNLRLAVRTCLTGRVPYNRHAIVYKLDYVHFIHKVWSTCNFLRIFDMYFFPVFSSGSFMCSAWLQGRVWFDSEVLFPRVTDCILPVDGKVQFWLVVLQFIFCSRLRDTQNLTIMNTWLVPWGGGSVWRW